MANDRPRHVLITGATRGLGKALAEYSVARGDLVSTTGRGHLVRLHESRHRHYQSDVSDEAAVAALFEQIRHDVGYLDALVNNAGAASMNLIALTPASVLRSVMAVNFDGTFLSSRAALRLLKAAPSPRIVNVSSVAVPLRLPGEAAYAAAKSAVETFTRIAAREFASFGITCNAIGPSPIKTDLVAGVPRASMSRLMSQQALARWAEAADFINVVEFFLSPQSAMVTGQIIYLGGVG